MAFLRFLEVDMPWEIFLIIKNRRLAVDVDFNTGFEIVFERQLWLHSLFELTAAFSTSVFTGIEKLTLSVEH